MYAPGNKRQGYVLRRSLRKLVRRGGTLDHPYFIEEMQRQERLKKRFTRLWPQHSNKPKAWWLDTHGIDLEDFRTSPEP